jgi:hypothetical protein
MPYSICKVTIKATEGRDDENLCNPRFLTAMEQETKHNLSTQSLSTAWHIIFDRRD